MQNTGWPGTVCKEAWTLLSSSTSKSTVEKNHDADDDGQSCSAKMSVVLVSVMVTMSLMLMTMMMTHNDNLLDAIPVVQGCSKVMVTVKGAGVLSSKVYSV